MFPSKAAKPLEVMGAPVDHLVVVVVAASTAMEEAHLTTVLAGAADSLEVAVIQESLGPLVMEAAGAVDSMEMGGTQVVTRVAAAAGAALTEDLQPLLVHPEVPEMEVMDWRVDKAVQEADWE